MSIGLILFILEAYYNATTVRQEARQRINIVIIIGTGYGNSHIFKKATYSIMSWKGEWPMKKKFSDILKAIFQQSIYIPYTFPKYIQMSLLNHEYIYLCVQ